MELLNLFLVLKDKRPKNGSTVKLSWKHRVSIINEILRIRVMFQSYLIMNFFIKGTNFKTSIY